MTLAAQWSIGTDAAEVHRLLCESDAFQAAKSESPVPQRRLVTTERLVQAGAVHVLHGGGELIAMFTLTEDPPFDLAEADYRRNVRALYMQRLAVSPAHAATGSMAGAQGVCRAIQVARQRGADALRCEANPDLTATVTLLDRLGFRTQGPIHGEPGGRRWVYLEYSL